MIWMVCLLSKPGEIKKSLIKGKKINFIGYADLLKVKEQSGRPQDIADLSKLKNRKKKK